MKFNKNFINLFKKYKLYILYFSLILLIYFVVEYVISYKFINYGVTKKYIRFGQSIVLSGLNKNSGIEYRDGILSGFNEYNSKNNNSKKPLLQLYSLDDQYEPNYALENVKLLINYYDVFSIIGSWGTPTSVAIYKYVSLLRSIPFLGPLTGSNILRKTFKENLFLIRPSYKDEIQTIFNHIKSQKKKHFSFLYQDDEFGNSVLEDIHTYLFNEIELQFLSKGNYIRNINNIENAIQNIFQIKNPFMDEDVKKSQLLNHIEFIIISGTVDQAFELIQFVNYYKPSIDIYCLSFTNTVGLLKKIKNIKNKQNIYATLTVPFYDKENNKKLLESLQDHLLQIKKDNITNLTPNLLEGYILGRFISEIIQNFPNDKNMNRYDFINEIYSKKEFNIDGYTLGAFQNKTNPCNVGLNSIYLVKYEFEEKDFKQILIDKKTTKCNF